MGYYNGIKCIRCGYIGREDNAFNGCPACFAQGINVNFSTYYDFKEDPERIRENFKMAKGPGLFTHIDFLPLNGKKVPVSIGEGNTPLIHLSRLGAQIGLSRLYLKNESVNPSWSYKDRLCSVAVNRALEQGVKVVTVSSTGNHGASAAAYAAAAGLDCVIFTTPSVPDTMKTLMQVYGAYVIATPTPGDRWKIMKYCVDNLGWYPLSGYMSPPVGSNCFGIDGYKTIAFELYEELGELPDFIAVPNAYADGLYGIYKGVCDLNKIGLSGKTTRMIAAEVFGSLKTTMSTGAEVPVSVASRPSISFSIAGPVGTYQGLKALQESNGYAETSSDEETLDMQFKLAKTEGIYAEAASVTTLTAIEKLARAGKISQDEIVVAVITSTGLKDTLTTAKAMPAVPVAEPTYEALEKALAESYGYHL